MIYPICEKQSNVLSFGELFPFRIAIANRNTFALGNLNGSENIFVHCTVVLKICCFYCIVIVLCRCVVNNAGIQHIRSHKNHVNVIFSALLENGSIASTVSKSFINADFKRQTTERKIKTLILSVEFATELAKYNTFSQLGSNDSVDRLERVIFTTAGNYMPEELADKYNHQDFPTVIDALNIPENITCKPSAI